MNILEILRVGAKNVDTTVAGAGLSALYYAGNVGFTLPHNEEGWIQFAISVAIFILTLLTKDARTGSAPK